MKSCPVCGSLSNIIAYRDTRKEGNFFMFCQTCSHGFCSEKPFQEIADEIEFNQNAFFGKEGDPFETWADFSATHEPSARWHCEHFKKYAYGNQLLDIGCGLGSFLKYVTKFTDFECHANDISPKAMKYVEQNLKIKTTTGVFAKELFLPSKFDIIYLSHVIEHIPDPISFVHNLRAICNPNAIVAIICPNDASFCSTIKRQLLFPLRKTHEYGQMHWPMHVQGFTPKSLNYLFTGNGFSPILETTWSRIQKESAYDYSFFRDSLLYPVYLSEYIFNRGGLIVSYFRLNPI